MSSNLRKLETPRESASGVAMDRRIERRFPRWVRPAAVGLALLLLAGIAWYVLLPEPGRSLRLGAETLTVSEVSLGTFEDFIPVRARVTPARTVFLDAIEGGRVEQVFVEDGARVTADQPLVRLSNTSLQLDVISREAQVTEQLNNLNTLKLQLEQNRLGHKRDLVEIDWNITRLTRLVERRRSLAKDAGISQQELEATEDELDYYKKRRAVTLEAQASDESLRKAQVEQLDAQTVQLRKNLSFARKNLESLNVRAPVAGKLTAFSVEIGQSLARGERLGQVDDADHFKLTALIDEFYLPRMDIGQAADVVVEGTHYALRVAKIYPQVRDGQFKIDLTFVNATPTGIRRGQTLQTRLTLGDPSKALLIPNGAFYQDTGGNWVFVVAADGHQAVKRNVRLGRRNARFIEVLEGLEQGERVITSPYSGFTDMDRLRFDKQ